eukprot:TRINITY_DN29758_c0_g1_i1.p1 TRINITY_DN29758_c0_g1~~TRINITY_DN29758_c0_g1_i1.p1  ORF type:complete len:520 (-),score=85.27 TRINITY_DN29758_c0_g1_i1:245-1804(-)
MSWDRSPSALKRDSGAPERLPSTPCRSLSSLFQEVRSTPSFPTSASPACSEPVESRETRPTGAARKERAKPNRASTVGTVGAVSADGKASARSVTKPPRRSARSAPAGSKILPNSVKDGAMRGRQNKRGEQDPMEKYDYSAEKELVRTPSPLSSERAIKKLRASASRVQQEHLAMRDMEDKAGTITVLAEEFMKKSPRKDGRPQRARFPVLNHWEGERLVFQRESGSLTPKVVALKKAEPTPKLEAKRRQSSCPPRSSKDRSVRPPASPCQALPADQLSAPEEQDRADHPIPLPPPPKRSCLKKTSSKRSRTGRVLTFKENPKEIAIQNFSHLTDLWTDSSAVECGKCQLAFPFGPGIKMEGEPGRSHFAQNEVICPNCIASQTYEEIGAWLVVALASRCTAAAQGSSANLEGIAEGPVTTLIESLAATRNLSRADKLAELLGSEAGEPEARREILNKAQSMVEVVLGSGVSKEDDLDQDEAEEAEGSDSEAGEAEGQSPPGDSAGPSGIGENSPSCSS